MTGMPAVVTTSVLATLAVSLWTLRVALTARNRRVLAAVTASVEATIFALAFSRLLTSLDSASQVIAYAIGVGIGTLIGLTINERLTPTTDSALRGTSLKPRRRGVTPRSLRAVLSPNPVLEQRRLDGACLAAGDRWR